MKPAILAGSSLLSWRAIVPPSEVSESQAHHRSCVRGLDVNSQPSVQTLVLDGGVARPGAMESWLKVVLFAAMALGAGCDHDPVVIPDGGPTPLEISPPAQPPHCDPLPDVACAIDVGETLPLHITGSTWHREDGYGGAGCGLGGDAIEDIAFRWTAPASATYNVSTEGSSFDTILSIRDRSCAGREIVCGDDLADGQSQSKIALDLAECRTVTIVVDGRSVDAIGDFSLTIHGNEAVCDDGRDNDGDGAADCDDDDCFGPACPSVDGWPEDWVALEWDVLQRINEVRGAGVVCGDEVMPPVPPLTMNRELQLAARWHSQDMTDQRYFAHDSLDGRMLGDRVAAAGFRGAGPLGENILRNSSDPMETVAGWLSSPGHCTNLMDPSFHVTGVGFALGIDGARFTQDFAGAS